MADGNTGQGTALTEKSGGYDLLKLQELHRQAKGIRSRFEPDWYLNTAFFIGQQWLRWSRQGRLDKPRLADWRRTPVDNRILPVVTSRVARKTKTRPTFTATPFTADEEDLKAAEIAEKVLSADWLNLNLQQQLYQAMLYSEICGAGFWKVYWDKTQGESADFLFQDGQPVTQANGQPVRADAFAEIPAGMEVRPVAAGDVCVDVLSPFEIYPDPLAHTLDECEWIIEEKVRSPEYVQKRFGVKLEPDAPAPVGPTESRMFSSLYYTAAQDAEEYKGVRVYEYWERPSTEYPNGKRCVWARDQILAEDDQPFDPMPYIMFSGTVAPGRFWPTSVTTQLRGPQVELNKLLGQIAENAARIGNPAIMKSRQANVVYTGLPGEEILYDSTVTDAIPSYLQAPEMPQYVQNLIDRIENSITEISGMHEVSKANVPSGVTAASAINLLQEADDTRLGPEVQDMELALANAGTKILMLRAQFNTDERTIRIAGEDGNWDIFSFRGLALAKNTNIEVQAGSAMPHSKAAKQAAMIEVLQLAFQYGLQLDPRDLRKFFKDYEVGGLDRLFAGVGSDEMQVNREHRLMAQGIPLNINEFDDDDFHIQSHQDHQKSSQYARYAPEIQNMIALHVQAHQERQVQQINLQMQQQAAEQANAQNQQAQLQMAQTAQQQQGQQQAQKGSA
jgi:hypothetical protein